MLMSKSTCAAGGGAFLGAGVGCFVATGDTIDFPYTCNVMTGSLREYERTQVTTLRKTHDDGGIV